MHSFNNHRALVVSRDNRDKALLLKQLRRLGLETVDVVAGRLAASGYCEKLRRGRNITLFDADVVRSADLPDTISNLLGQPSVAILSSDSPSMVEWSIAQGATSVLMRPIRHAGILASLIMSTCNHESFQTLEKRIHELKERVKARPIVCGAVVRMMNRYDLEETEAFELLRRMSMNTQVYLEQMAALIVSGEIRLPDEGDVDKVKEQLIAKWPRYG